MKLTKRIEIYVPDLPGHEEASQETARLLSSICGGATELQATGSWIDDQGKLIPDKITLVYAYYNALSLRDLRAIVQRVLRLKQELQQQLISVTFAGSLHLI